ncbi:hypothetical protein [Nocardioides campestrisoli]|uniref:hypothetical protein n=1 Tax=Nocardioides campestrisoli TaxID=2736757 RepID=UPI0015E76B15|nr:hypothetical protein [Nocardioides campestrisoli]
MPSADEYTYSVHGDILTSTGPGDAAGQSVYRHTLGFHDNGTATTGYTKHGIRWNDNLTGTWTTQDPLNAPMDPANGNRYLYASGDPINNQDHMDTSARGLKMRSGLLHG